MQDLKEQAGTWQYSRVPIWDKSPEDIVGLANRRDVLLAIGEDRWATTLGDIMRPVHFVLEIHRLNALLERFLETRQHLLVALDEHGAFVGVVTLEDLIEEILGEEIVDEFDRVTDLRQLAHARRDKTLKR
jgi:CBS domain containing-hemolysin-like protein